MQLDHTNVCKPIKLAVLDKNNYFLLYIDVFSRKMWVFIWKQKFDVLGAFKKFEAFIEKQDIKGIYRIL